MKFIANAINNYYPRNLVEKLRTPKILDAIEEVKVAVSYAWNKPELFDFCCKHGIPLSFYCRYDNGVPVSPAILDWFIGKQSKRIVCKLAGDYFHAKVIWAVGHGVYIGSANLTDRAWFDNLEAGVFLSEDEIDFLEQREQLEVFFDHLEETSKALTQEIIAQLKERQERFKKIQKMIDDFEKEEKASRLVPPSTNLISVNKKPHQEKRKEAFIEEWNETLEILREIGDTVSTSYRPAWVADTVPKTTQGDQFLHAYYYNFVVEKNASTHRMLHEVNKGNRSSALSVAMNWWKNTQSPPSGEDRQFYEWGPSILKLVRPDRILSLSELEFIDLCCKIHAFRNHSRQIRYDTLAMGPGEAVSDGEDKIRKGAEWVFHRRSARGRTALELIYFLLYSGKEQNISLRLWEAHRSDEWKIPHFGLGALGELVGWALPEKFCPRNGRTSKALYALGYKVRVYSE
jgi:hypothetical protein